MPTLKYIDKHLETWKNKIKDTSEHTEPKIHHRTIRSLNPTYKIKQTQLSHNRLLNNINTYEQSIHKLNLLQLRYQLHQQYRDITNGNRNNLIQNLIVQTTQNNSDNPSTEY